MAASLLFVIPHLNAQDRSSEQASLKIKPLTCIVKRIGEQCQMTVKLSWQTATPQNACLYQGDTRLKCWQAVTNVTEPMTIKLDKNMTFYLRDAETKLLAKQQIQVNAMVSKKYRRKLKSDWSLF